MTRTRTLLVGLAAGLAFAAPCHAQGVAPTPGPGDPRIRYVSYDPDQVIALSGHLGYEMMIEFGDNEQIQNISIGDGVSWQVTPNRAANLLFVKPVERNARTNLTVVTNLRRYSFELTAFESNQALDNLTYDLRFHYPTPPLPPPAPAAHDSQPARINADYSFSGSRELRPERVFDDEQSTYFEFGAGKDAPAIFAIGSDGGEELVNQQVRGPYTVVDRVAAAFVLRYGREHTRVHNDRISPRSGIHWPWRRRTRANQTPGGEP